jgi:D-xylose transport system substrate-binding protein
MVIISGSKTDQNALGFSKGAHEILDPLLAQGKLKDVYEAFTANWDPNVAQAEMEAALTDQQNNIQIAYVANDDMAQTVIAALKAVGLAGKVLVTGQDATAGGIHSILLGQQNMTVYKPIAQEAASVGALVKAISQGTDTNALTKGLVTNTTDGGVIPSILNTPLTVDQGNISTTVIADGFLTPKQVCQGIPAGKAKVC